MFDWIVTLIPTLPWMASLLAGFYRLRGRTHPETDAIRCAWLILTGIGLSILLACLSLILAQYGLINRVITLGRWLDSGDFHVALSLLAEPQTLGAAALFSGLILLVTRFTLNDPQREIASWRFFPVMGLFAGAMAWLVLAGNLVLTLLGWELAGLCAFLLRADARKDPMTTPHAHRTFLTHRVSVTGFSLALVVAYTTGGSLEWSNILAELPARGEVPTGSLILCLLVPAMAGSARIRHCPDRATRAIESSILMPVGVFLVLRLEPLFTVTPWAMTLLAIAGLLILIYGYLCGLIQSDPETTPIFAALRQTGLIFLLAGGGFWYGAGGYMAAHAVFRALQCLNGFPYPALSWPTRHPPPLLTRQRWLYRLSLHGFHLGAICDRILVKPCLNLSRDCERFDREIIDKDPAWSTSALQQLTSLGTYLETLEKRLILHDLDQKILRGIRQQGRRLERVEKTLALPHYWWLWMILGMLILV